MSSLEKDSLLTLWAIPKKREISSLIDIKNKIDKQLLGPDFPLHMTLSPKFDHSELELKKLIPEFSNSISPFEVFFREYGMKEYFFQSFYVAIDLDKKLKEVRSKVCKILKVENQIFMPHLSLYYGKQTLQNKKKILEDLPFVDGKFKVESIYIVSFDPSNVEWKVLNTINLKSLNK